MARFIFEPIDWFDEAALKFMEANRAAVPFSKAALYEGAKVLADSVHSAASAHGSLANGLDLSKMQTSSDGADIELGFGGYDAKGTPYKLIAAVLESGNSKTGTAGTHFFSRAFNTAKGRAKEAMAAKYWELMNKLLDF